MKKSTVRVTIIFICLIVAVVGCYAYLSNRKRAARAEATMTITQETLSRDLQNNYPATPKEVIRYYNDILRCFYNEECTEEELDALGQQARELYDRELLEANETGAYMIRLRQDIQDFKDNERRISNFSLAASTSVIRFQEDGFEFARIMCGYNIVEKKKNYSMAYIYLLRQDEDKRWKIYGWEDEAKLQSDQDSAGAPVQ